MLCSYCGEYADSWDHVVPVSYRAENRSLIKKRDNAVPCCRECNTLLGNCFNHSVSTRAEYLIKKLKKKYKSIIRMPKWGEDELEDISGDFSRQIRASMDMKSILCDRFNHIRETVLSDYSANDCKLKFENMEYKPIRCVRFTNSSDKIHEVFMDEISVSSIIFENTAIDRAIGILEGRGVITSDYDIEVIR